MEEAREMSDAEVAPFFAQHCAFENPTTSSAIQLCLSAASGDAGAIRQFLGRFDNNAVACYQLEICSGDQATNPDLLDDLMYRANDGAFKLQPEARAQLDFVLQSKEVPSVTPTTSTTPSASGKCFTVLDHMICTENFEKMEEVDDPYLCRQTCVSEERFNRCQHGFSWVPEWRECRLALGNQTCGHEYYPIGTYYAACETIQATPSPSSVPSGVCFDSEMSIKCAESGSDTIYDVDHVDLCKHECYQEKYDYCRNGFSYVPEWRQCQIGTSPGCNRAAYPIGEFFTRCDAPLPEILLVDGISMNKKADAPAPAAIFTSSYSGMFEADGLAAIPAPGPSLDPSVTPAASPSISESAIPAELLTKIDNLHKRHQAEAQTKVNAAIQAQKAALLTAHSVLHHHVIEDRSAAPAVKEVEEVEEVEEVKEEPSLAVVCEEEMQMSQDKQNSFAHSSSKRARMIRQRRTRHRAAAKRRRRKHARTRGKAHGGKQHGGKQHGGKQHGGQITKIVPWHNNDDSDLSDFEMWDKETFPSNEEFEDMDFDEEEELELDQRPGDWPDFDPSGFGSLMSKKHHQHAKNAKKHH